MKELIVFIKEPEVIFLEKGKKRKEKKKTMPSK
jgi:hypothetical protein